jgi:hypothetical protein
LDLEFSHNPDKLNVMSVLKFRILLGTAVFLSLLLLVNTWLTYQNAVKGNLISQQQQVIGQGQQAEQIMRSLGVRIAQAADKDPAMREIMVRNQLNATIEVDGQRKNIP